MVSDWKLLQGDVLAKLAEMPDESVHCCVTSPPYWGLRDYGVEGMIGLEPTIEEYIEKMVMVCREIRRVLRKDGTFWLNMGDCYSAGKPKLDEDFDRGDLNWSKRQSFRRDRRPREDDPHKAVAGLMPKNLVGQPWRLAFALQADGWWLRSDIIWHKPNPMPESVTDRPTKAHEYLFLLAKSAKYFYDAKAVREDNAPAGKARIESSPGTGSGMSIGTGGERYARLQSVGTEASGRNRRDVWTIPTQPFSGSGYLADYVGRDGKPYKASQDCPIHGHLALRRIRRKAERDEPKGLSVSHNVDKPSCHVSERQHESASNRSRDQAPILPSNGRERIYENIDDRKTSDSSQMVEPQKHLRTQGKQEKCASSSDSSARDNSLAATDRNKQSRKKGRAASTNPSCKPCAESSCRTDDKQESLVDSDVSCPNYNTAKCTCQVVSVDHFATFPEKLVEPCILAGTSRKGCCPKCGAPWKRIISEAKGGAIGRAKGWHDHEDDGGVGQSQKKMSSKGYKPGKTIGWQPTCECGLESVPCTVLDCFSGSGTTGVVAIKNGCDYIGIELNPEYVAMSKKRLKGVSTGLTKRELEEGQMALYE